MNEYIHKNYKKAARIQTVVCGFLFSIFSFIYLYVFQCDVLEALHFSLAHGKTHFAPLPSAIIITLILLLLRWGVNSLLGLGMAAASDITDIFFSYFLVTKGFPCTIECRK